MYTTTSNTAGSPSGVSSALGRGVVADRGGGVTSSQQGTHISPTMADAVEWAIERRPRPQINIRLVLKYGHAKRFGLFKSHPIGETFESDDQKYHIGS
jgi:hypothetical protein